MGLRKTVEVVPRARRTLTSLRNLGYDLRHAVADIVDNSISAGATVVDITVHFAGRGSWIRISDNGRGMNAEELTEAFRYGSDREYSKTELGRFGFGLKAASTSQCRKVTVISRADTSGAALEGRELDVDHIAEVDNWEIFELAPDELPEGARSVLGDGPGTVVLWEDLDRVLQYQDPFGGWAKRQLIACAEDIDQHLAMVFHRFLAGEVADGELLRITVNGSRVEPWDPFCRAESGTSPLQEEDLEVRSRGGNGIVRLRPFVLPNQDGFSSSAAWKRASGPKNWNRQQGFYVYRADRMIQAGGWCRLRAVEEHTKLARVSLEFFPELDSAFGVNVAKASVTLPEELRVALGPLVSTWCGVANTAYRLKRRPTSSTPTRPRSSSTPTGRHISQTNPSQDAPDRVRGDAQPKGAASPALASGAPAATSQIVDPPASSARQALEAAAAQVGEDSALARIVTALRTMSPEVARDLGW
ncbi:ATP-binding protein [Streptomyces sp. MBT49]|uniref:ATP-binding protein n=1 Tax=Streptomyces sp. MBT49 TaxID=1488380 RepID=UPI00190D2352|nr:ATP-binding protein [Streptomyces sp. MBT49]MBK3625356.1 ATP-binding protein [Streptomyces sp. MBT49]